MEVFDKEDYIGYNIIRNHSSNIRDKEYGFEGLSGASNRTGGKLCRKQALRNSSLVYFGERACRSMEEKWEKENIELWNSGVMAKVYGGANYKEIHCNASSDICIIFFSSNGLYYPNTFEEFQETVVNSDRYEWEKYAREDGIQDYAGKIILVRDVFKQWYVKGISSIYDSVDMVFKLLEELTRGYHVITAGNSSGGYAAVLFGLKLGAKRAFSFSGQFSVEDEVADYYWLSLYRNDRRRSRYYELLPMLDENKEIPVYYFYPALCRQDVEQYSLVKDRDEVYSFAFHCGNHGETLQNEDFSRILVQTDAELQEMCKRRRGSLIDKNAFLD